MSNEVDPIVPEYRKAVTSDMATLGALLPAERKRLWLRREVAKKIDGPSIQLLDQGYCQVDQVVEIRGS